MVSTTKTFFSAEVEKLQSSQRSRSKVTKGDYPQLHTANRENHLAYLNATKNSFAFAKHAPVKTNSQMPQQASYNPKFNMQKQNSNSAKKNINKGSHIEIPTSSRISSLNAANVIFSARNDPSSLNTLAYGGATDAIRVSRNDGINNSVLHSL